MTTGYDCGCADCGCNSCATGNEVRAGAAVPAYLNYQTTGADAIIGANTTQVDVCGTNNVTLTLPKMPRIGRFPLTINNTGSGTVTVVSPDNVIEGQDPQGRIFIQPYSSAQLEFSACGACGIWSVLFGQRAPGSYIGEIIVPNLAAVSALTTAILPQGVYARPLTIDQPFELDKTSTEAVDGITVLATDTGTGRWLRRSIHVPRWSDQQAWYVDPVLGNDEYDGNTAATALKTLAEWSRRVVRMRVQKTSAYYTINLLNDIPDADAFRPTGEIAPDDSDDNVFPFVILGKMTAGTTGSVGAGTAATNLAANTQAVFDAGQVLPASDIGKLVHIPSTGAMAWIVAANGGNLYRVSQWFTLNASFSLTNVVPPVAGVAYEIVDLTSFGPAFLSIGSPILRARFAYVKFPSTALAEPNCIKAIATSFNACRFQSRIAFSFSNGAFFGCGFDFSTLTELGWSFANYSFNSCSFLNASIAPMSGANIQLTDVLIQGGFVRTLTTVAQPAFGGAGGAGRFPAPNIVVGTATGGFGLGIFDAPAAAGVNGAFMLKNMGVGRITGPIYGSNPLVATGIAVSEGSRLGILSTITVSSNKLKIEGAPGQNLELDGSATALQNIADLSPGVQSGQGILGPGGTTVVNATVTPSSKIIATTNTPSGGAAPGNSVLSIPQANRVVGIAGSFTVNAADAAATSTFDWVIEQSPVPLATFAQWEGTLDTDGFARNVVSYKTGAAIFDVAAA